MKGTQQAGVSPSVLSTLPLSVTSRRLLLHFDAGLGRYFFTFLRFPPAPPPPSEFVIHANVLNWETVCGQIK